MELQTIDAAAAPVVTAPDGSAVRVLCGLARGGMALFTLAPGAVSRAVAHRTVEELWYVAAGRGRMWRRLGDAESVVDLFPGVALALPTGAHFQFRCDGAEPLVAVGATMPPWPGESEAYAVGGPWSSTA
jgi:mannose-6-phosphate isomerase-like protein (cupin superfamily)